MEFPLLLLLLLLPSSVVAAKTLPPVVLDINNNTVLTATDYFIVPANNRQGAITLFPPRDNDNDTDKCPLDVIEDVSSSAAATRLSVTLYSVKPNDTVVRTSTDHNIVSASTGNCSKYSTVWKLGRFDDTSGKWFLTTGGVLGQPGRRTVSNWFKIEAYKNAYKLVFCPHVCRYCKVVCGDVGIAGGDIQRRFLGISNAPLPVVFVKK